MNELTMDDKNRLEKLLRDVNEAEELTKRLGRIIQQIRGSAQQRAVVLGLEEQMRHKKSPLLNALNTIVLVSDDKEGTLTSPMNCAKSWT